MQDFTNSDGFCGDDPEKKKDSKISFENIAAEVFVFSDFNRFSGTGTKKLKRTIQYNHYNPSPSPLYIFLY
jgi:hypothetical protein